MKTQTRITESQNVSFVTAVADGTKLGYKYFDCKGVTALALELRGSFTGKVTVSTDEKGENPVGAADLAVKNGSWHLAPISVSIPDGVHALYFTFAGEGQMDVKSIVFVG